MNFTQTMLRLQDQWAVLMNTPTKLPELCADEELRAALLELMWIADEACSGLGKVASHSSVFARRYASDAAQLATRREALSSRRTAPSPLAEAEADLLARQQTLCELVPAARLCIQPKMRTPQVGCTIRAMSHHVALLPSSIEVRTVWRPYPGEVSDDTKTERHVMNMLLIPYPFTMPGRSIVPTKWDASAGTGWFNVEQQWLNRASSREPDAHQLVLELIRTAEAESVSKVHGVVLPECALDEQTAKRIATSLEKTNVELFITGIGGEENQNVVRGWTYGGSTPRRSDREWKQGKHHRWNLERNQIRRYNLGHSLRPEHNWWEDIALGERTIELLGSAGGGALAALICEDLARIDPVQTILRSVGPNLVIALLMDGPQTTHRWSARYATVLADDPGSSVITLTSAGMVRRSYEPGDSERLCVGLWKDSSGMTKELVLPADAHGLLLSIARHKVAQFTLDDRWDGAATTQLELAGIEAIRFAGQPSKKSARAAQGKSTGPHDGASTDHLLNRMDDEWATRGTQAVEAAAAEARLRTGPSYADYEERANRAIGRTRGESGIFVSGGSEKDAAGDDQAEVAP